MKQITKLIAFGVLFAVSCSSVMAEMTIRWGTTAGYKPFIYKTADGSLTGFDVEIGDALCEHLNATCTWVEQEWDGIIPGLQARKYDAILASISITEKRRQIIDFTDKYYHIGARFVGRVDANLNDGDGLAGKAVGVERGTTFDIYLRNERPDVDVRAYPGLDEAWLDLQAGRLDAVFVNKIVANDGFLKDQDEGVYEMFGREYLETEHFGEGTAIGVRKSDQDLRAALNEALQTLRQNGTYKEINDKYFPFDIYGE